MDERAHVDRLWTHCFWADRALAKAVTSAEYYGDALKEFAHVIGAEEVWLARLERRAPDLAVWPSLSPSELPSKMTRTHERWTSYLSALDEADFRTTVRYTNSAGRVFENMVADILVHVALHGQYHRGKVNMMLRQAGLAPVPVDYIAFVRGAPAATRSDQA